MTLQTSVSPPGVSTIEMTTERRPERTVIFKKSAVNPNGDVLIRIRNGLTGQNVAVLLTSEEWRTILEFIAPADIAAILHITPEQVTS